MKTRRVSYLWAGVPTALALFVGCSGGQGAPSNSVHDSVIDGR